MQAASAALAALAGRAGSGVGVSPSDLADLLGVASNVLRERGRLASAAGTGPQAVAAAAAEAAELEALVRDVVAAAGRGMAPGEPAIELVADFYVALAALDSAAALSGAVVGSGGVNGISSPFTLSPAGVLVAQPEGRPKALPARRFVAAPTSASSVASAAAALAALAPAAAPAAASPPSSNATSTALRRSRSLLQTPPPPAASPYLVLPADLAAACLSDPTACGPTGDLAPNFAFMLDSQLLVAANQPVSVGAVVRYDAAALTGALAWWLEDPASPGVQFASLPAGASPARLALPFAADPTVARPGTGLASPISLPDPALYARACLRLSGPSQWALEAFDGEDASAGLAFCLTRNTGTFVVVTYPISSSSGGGGGSGGVSGGSTPTPTATTPPSTTTPPPGGGGGGGTSQPWIPPSPTGGFIVGSGTPPFGPGPATTPQIAFYILFDGFADAAAFESAGGRTRFEDDLRAFFLSTLPWAPDHLLQRLSIFDVRTGASGSGALVGAAAEFVGGATGARAALLLQKVVTLLSQPSLVFGSSFYGRPTALSVEAYGGAVDPSSLTSGGGTGTGGGGGGGGGGIGGTGSSGLANKKTNAGAVAGGVVGGLAALALLSFVAARLVRGRRRSAAASSASASASSSPSSSSAAPSPQQQFIANAAADPTRPQATAVSAPVVTTAAQPPQPPPPPPPAAGSAGGNGLETPLVA